MSIEHDGIKQLNNQEVLEAYHLQDENTILLDVRENEEYKAGHIPGVKLLPTSEFIERFEQELAKGKNYIVICRSGGRSQNVCKFLQEQGFERIVNFSGGMLDWKGPLEYSN